MEEQDRPDSLPRGEPVATPTSAPLDGFVHLGEALLWLETFDQRIGAARDPDGAALPPAPDREQQLFKVLSAGELVAVDQSDQPIPTGVWLAASSTDPQARTLVRYIDDRRTFGGHLTVRASGPEDGDKTYLGLRLRKPAVRTVFGPRQRRDLTQRVRAGYLSEAQANDIAAEFGLGDLRAAQRIVTPMSEAFWPLPAILAWIQTRDAKEVARAWWSASEGDREDGAASDSPPPPHSSAELREFEAAARSGRILATGIPTMTTGTTLPLRREIPKLEWQDLSLTQSLGGVVARRPGTDIGYDAILVSRDAVLKRWKRLSADEVIERRVTKWLAEQMASHATAPKPKDDIFDDMCARYPKFSRYRFNRAWANAIRQTGSSWSKGGRPSRRPASRTVVSRRVV